MSDQGASGDWLDGVKARLGRIPPADPNDFPHLVGGWYAEDVPRLVAEVEVLRGRLADCQASEFHGMHTEMVGLHRGLEVRAAEVERLRDLLGKLEWAGPAVFAGGGFRQGSRTCPACGGVEQGTGHKPNCRLAAELRA
jgi:hypothetical protein